MRHTSDREDFSLTLVYGVRSFVAPSLDAPFVNCSWLKNNNDNN